VFNFGRRHYQGRRNYFNFFFVATRVTGTHYLEKNSLVRFAAEGSGTVNVSVGIEHNPGLWISAILSNKSEDICECPRSFLGRTQLINVSTCGFAGGPVLAIASPVLA